MPVRFIPEALAKKVHKRTDLGSKVALVRVHRVERSILRHGRIALQHFFETSRLERGSHQPQRHQDQPKTENYRWDTISWRRLTFERLGGSKVI